MQIYGNDWDQFSVLLSVGYLNGWEFHSLILEMGQKRVFFFVSIKRYIICLCIQRIVIVLIYRIDILRLDVTRRFIE